MGFGIIVWGRCSLLGWVGIAFGIWHPEACKNDNDVND